MGLYSKVTDARGVVRYRDENKNAFTKGDEVPEAVKEVLADQEDGVHVMFDNGSASVVEKEQENTDAPEAEGEGEESPAENSDGGEGEAPAETETGDDGVEENVPDPAADGDDSEEEADDETDTDEEGDGIDTEIQAPTPDTSDEEGMGFPRANGKTLSIFSKKPHEVVRFVAGITVPLTKKEYDEKSDQEIISKLKKMGKL